MLLHDRIWWPRLPCSRQWGGCGTVLLQAPRCCKGWGVEFDSVGWDGKSSPAPRRCSNGELWVPTVALVAAVLISAARKVPVGVRMLGLVSVLALGFVVRDQVLRGDFSEIDWVVEGFIGRRRNKAVDNVSVVSCLNKLEGVMLAMKAQGQHEEEYLAELQQSLESLKRLLLDRGHAHVKTGPDASGDMNGASQRASSDQILVKPEEKDEQSWPLKEQKQDERGSGKHQYVDKQTEEQDNDPVELDDITQRTKPEGRQQSEKQEADEQTSEDKSEHVFNSKLQEADKLLQQGQSWLQDGTDYGLTAADASLDRAIHLLNQAVEMKPSNLVAVGMLANALLLRGQVKLKAVQRLDEAEKTLSKDEVDKLQRVCDGCEELLIEAGRAYRKALLIDRKDFRALHNWGVALSSRAELLCLEEAAYEVQEGSVYADKLYLAAIDKFEAVVGLDQDHAAPALVNWAMAVRNRSRLKNRSTKEKLTLLLQARQLLLDAAKLDPSHLQVTADVTRCELEEEISRLQRHRR